MLQFPPILKSKVRILRPEEFQILNEAAKTEDNRGKIGGLLYTGMRYIEAQRFQTNKHWLDPRGFVFLPREAILKAQRHQLERWVKLSPQGVSAVQVFLKCRKLPAWEGWTQNLQRWAVEGGLDPIGLGPKTFRKTWESWLVSLYPQFLPQITMSQGHTIQTSMGYYLNMPFTNEDMEKIRPYVEGMFGP